jgi:DNA modification methylase
MDIKQGDCIELMQQLPAESVDCIITDPPYGINYQSAWRIDSERFDKLDGDLKIDTSCIPLFYRLLKEGSALYIFTRWDVYPEWLNAISRSGFMVKNCLIWDRGIHGLGDLNGCYAPRYDMIIFATKGRHLLKGGRPIDVIKVNRIDPEHLLHPTEKPVKLIRYLIEHSTKEKDIILDSFMGSGTTGVACQQLDREFIGMELNEAYFRIAEKRINEATKQVRL